MKVFVIISCLYLWTCMYVAQGQQICPPGTYLDQVTGHCDSCQDICQSSDVQGTQEECRQNCPDYDKGFRQATPTKKCLLGMFYDPVVSKCDYCSTVCDDHEIQGTTKDCMFYCPDYKNSIQKSVLTPEKGKSLAPVAAAIIAILSLAIVLAVVSVIVVKRKKLQQRISCLRRDTDEGDNENNPLTASVSASDESVNIPIEEVGEQELAFTDLRSGRSNDT